jgi:hypothetical protein
MPNGARRGVRFGDDAAGKVLQRVGARYSLSPLAAATIPSGCESRRGAEYGSKRRFAALRPVDAYDWL